MGIRKSDEISEKEIQTPKVTEKDTVLNLIRVKMEGVTFPVPEAFLNYNSKDTIMKLLEKLDDALNTQEKGKHSNELAKDKASRENEARLTAIKSYYSKEEDKNKRILLEHASGLLLQRDLTKVKGRPLPLQPLDEYLREAVIGSKITGKSMVDYFEKGELGGDDEELNKYKLIYGGEVFKKAFKKALKDAMESKRKDLYFLINESVRNENKGEVEANLDKYINPQPKSFPSRFFSAVQAFFKPGKSVEEAFRQEEDFTVDQKAKDFSDRLEGLTYSASMTILIRETLIREIVKNLDKYSAPNDRQNAGQRRDKLIESLYDSVRLMKMILDSIPDPIPDPIIKSQFKKSFEVFKEDIISKIDEMDKILGVEVKETVEQSLQSLQRLQRLDSARAEAPEKAPEKAAEALAEPLDIPPPAPEAALAPPTAVYAPRLISIAEIGKEVAAIAKAKAKAREENKIEVPAIPDLKKPPKTK